MPVGYYVVELWTSGEGWNARCLVTTTCDAGQEGRTVLFRPIVTPYVILVSTPVDAVRPLIATLCTLGTN